jgi:hypothetical protein
MRPSGRGLEVKVASSSAARLNRSPLLLAVALTSLLITPLLAASGKLGGAGDLPVSRAPYAEASLLGSNAANLVRTFVSADEEAGLTQIQALVPRASLEEQWAYVPAVGLWIEIGRNESGSEADPQVETDVEYLRAIVGLFGAVHLIHLHPASVYAGGAWDERLFPVRYPAAAIAPDDLRPIGYALPSPDDVRSSIELSEIVGHDNPQENIRHSVVGPHGIVSYGPTAAGRAKLLSESGYPLATTARDIVTGIVVRRAEFNIERTISMLESPTIGEVIASLCAQASDEHFQVPFMPF